MLDLTVTANIVVVDTGNGSAPTSSDGLVNGKGGFWLDTTNHQCVMLKTVKDSIVGLVSKGGTTTLSERVNNKSVKAKSQGNTTKFTASDTDLLLKLFMDSTFKGEQIDKAHSVLSKLVTLHREKRMNKTTSVRLDIIQLDYKSSVEQCQIAGRDAKIVADCLGKIQKAENKLLAPPKDSNLVLNETEN